MNGGIGPAENSRLTFLGEHCKIQARVAVAMGQPADMDQKRRKFSFVILLGEHCKIQARAAVVNRMASRMAKRMDSYMVSRTASHLSFTVSRNLWTQTPAILLVTLAGFPSEWPAARPASRQTSQELPLRHARDGYSGYSICDPSSFDSSAFAILFSFRSIALSCHIKIAK